MNRIGIYYAYWERDWTTNLFAHVPRAARLGFDVLEFKLSEALALSKKERRELRRLAHEHEIELTFVEGLSPVYDVSSPDPSVRARGIQYIKRGLNVISELGGTLLGGIIYGAWNPPLEKCPPKQECLRRSVESMREIMTAAEGLGITCCVEVVNRFEQFMLNTCAEAVEYVDLVGSPNLKIMLDTFHMNIEEDSIRDAVVLAGDRLGHLHVGETNRRLPGQGRFPWAELIGALQEIDYRGRIVMEPFVRPGGEVGRDIRVWRELAADKDPDEEARRALQFLRELLSTPFRR